MHLNFFYCTESVKIFEVEHSSRGRGGNHRGSHGPRTHGHYDNQNDFSESLVKGPLSPNDDRTVIATDKNIKVTVNHGNMPVKGPVMSVKGRISNYFLI